MTCFRTCVYTSKCHRDLPEDEKPSISDICAEPKKYWLEVTGGIMSLGFGHVFGENWFITGHKYNDNLSDDFKTIKLYLLYSNYLSKFLPLRNYGQNNEVVFYPTGITDYFVFSHSLDQSGLVCPVTFI